MKFDTEFRKWKRGSEEAALVAARKHFIIVLASEYSGKRSRALFLSRLKPKLANQMDLRLH